MYDTTTITEIDIQAKEHDRFYAMFLAKWDDDTLFDFTGMTALLQVRKTARREPVLVLSSEIGTEITLNSLGVIIIQSDDIDFHGFYKYELQITKDGKITTILNGVFEVLKDITY